MTMKSSDRIIYVRADGVLVDMEKAYLQALFSNQSNKYQLVYDDWLEFCEAYVGLPSVNMFREFLESEELPYIPELMTHAYASLIPGALEFLGKLETYATVKMVIQDGSAEQNAFLGSAPRVLTVVKQKEHLAAPHIVLVDHDTDSVSSFMNAGGRATLIPRPWNRKRAHYNRYDGDHKLAYDHVIEQVENAVFSMKG